MGDGTTDDTDALQSVTDTAAASDKVVFFDAGIIGEAFPVILSSGEFFNNQDEPKPVIQVRQPGEKGHVELSDLVISTQGTQAGATPSEYNLASPSDPSGLWEMHARVGGFVLSADDCVVCQTPETVITEADPKCTVAYMLMHVTPSASNLYLENTWLWVSDHDIDVQTEADGGQITLYSGRGFEHREHRGKHLAVWCIRRTQRAVRVPVVSTKNVYMGQIQTEIAVRPPSIVCLSVIPPSSLSFTGSHPCRISNVGNAATR
ncbi:hypothetical protein BJX63DRAFT_438602 [Aspergillus granulosus]|uniref:Uncharacterized protein n=1 Tax=Aspergillus granulosus TaxID=176169 RepID=A0ABR4GRG3_9EURO